MQKCENAKISKRCENANAMRKSEKIRIALLFSFKKTGKIIDRSFFRILIRIALPALRAWTIDVKMVVFLCQIKGCVTISNPGLLSSGETGVNPGIRSC
jgi:hypothetical protein